MRWSSSLALLVAFIQIAASKPLTSKRWDEFDVKHAWADVPKGWELHGPAPADHALDMRIALKQDRFDDLVSTLYEVSDPYHSKYGQHLSKEEVEALVAPHPDTVSVVDSWLSAHDIDLASVQRDNGGSWITVRVSVEQASRMLNATYGVYRHAKTSDYVVRTTSYSLPRILHDHIGVVTPTTYFSTVRSMKATSFLQPQIEALQDGDADIASSLVAPDPTPLFPRAAAPRSLLRVSVLCTTLPHMCPKLLPRTASGLLAILNSLRTTLTYKTDAVGGTFTHVQVNGGENDQSNPGDEANLDIQYTEGMTFPTPNIYYSTGGSPPFVPDSNTPTNTNEPYLDWLNFIAAQTSIPQTFTTSYGDDEQSVPLDYSTNVCNLFAQLGVRGSSIMFSSGDDGVGAGDCLTNDGTNTKEFQPNFPASCPFVTTVGGTTRVNPETAVSFSGGGFSNVFAQPSYQASAVSAFLKGLGSTNKGLFNTTGRAYPDVSAQGQGFQVVIGGRVSSIGGTSASSPTFSGVIALLNDFRLSQGKSSLGFLNPLIYSTGAAGFNDITSGSNPGCGTNGFTAGPGWDPVTGLGTPDFGKLQSLIG
ncbi:hypothetical protein EUX98_g6437 [Antrodiella citrinella]|uniref:tripeptidyl-peptidase II n=1 Tax=Antrodiella citrinella TaxID=2447956 RepID=A0A4S4MP46_9APHY|nr:hypothetical protein EUX98_g6437 [Antrodiella citrinella]